MGPFQKIELKNVQLVLDLAIGGSVSTTTTANTTKIITTIPTTSTTTSTIITTTTTAIPTSGSIEHLDYKANENFIWKVIPPCSEVHVLSTTFQTEADYDFVFVGEISYTGLTTIDQIVTGPFDVKFTSDESQQMNGFQITWECEG